VYTDAELDTHCILSVLLRFGKRNGAAQQTWRGCNIKENWNQDTMHKRNLVILAGNFVWSIAVAPDGTLWFGTDHGLSHFDGETWTTYTMEDGLPSTPITSIAVTADGKLWFSSGGGYISQYVPSD
jgi:ligand-binding sensor domain-containing protein